MSAINFDQHAEHQNEIVDHDEQGSETGSASDDEFEPCKREQYIMAEIERQVLGDEFKQHVAQMHAVDIGHMSLEWWTAREKGLLHDEIASKLARRDRDEINAEHKRPNPLELTPELDEKIKRVANKLTSKMLEDIAEYTATLSDVNYRLIKERVLYKIHPGNYTSMHQAIYEQHQAFAEHVDTDLLTDEIDAIHADTCQ